MRKTFFIDNSTINSSIELNNRFQAFLNDMKQHVYESLNTETNLQLLFEKHRSKWLLCIWHNNNNNDFILSG